MWNQLGAFLCVNQGILPDGKVVAVKRLFFKSKRTADDFFNKVNLISGINHKNLVKLLGCSITGPKSLLVYEYVPNLSLLDNFSGIEIILNSCSYKNINFSYSVHLLVRLLSQLKLILSWWGGMQGIRSYWVQLRAWPIFMRNQIWELSIKIWN